MGDVNIGTLKGFISLQDDFSGPIDKIAKSLGIPRESLGALAGAAGIAVSAIAGTTAAIVALGMHGADVADVRGAFENLTTRAGESADVMLGKLNEGTLNTISNFELMKLANNVLGSGMVKTAADMGTLAAGAKLLADRTGGDTAEAFATLSEAMAKGTSRQAELKFLFRDSDVVVAAYAKSIGKLPKDLTDAEIATAKTQGAMANLRDELAAAGPASADFGDNIAQGKKAIQDFVDGLGEAIATSPVLRAGMDSMGESLRAAFGGKQKDTVSILMGFVNQFAIALTYVGQAAVVVATVLNTVLAPAWDFIKIAVLGVMTVVAGLASGFVSIVAGAASLAAAIPGASQGVKDFAGKATQMAFAADDVARGLKAQTEEAAEAAKGNSSLQGTLDKVGGALVLMRDKMEAASGKQALLTAGAQPLIDKVKELGEAVEATWSSQFNDAMEMLAPLFAEAEAKMILFGETYATLMNEITLANKTGLDLQLTDIQLQSEAKLAALAEEFGATSLAYTSLETLIKEKYAGQTAAAIESFVAQSEAATVSNETQIQAAERNLQEQTRRLEQLRATHQATGEQIAAQNSAVWAAQDKLDEEKTQLALGRMNLIADAASTLLKTIFGKNKTAMIAAVIIETAAAVITSFKNGGGYPWGLIPAGIMAATGIAQIAKIRSTNPGFAQGTPGTAFEDFGAGSMRMLHGQEAVINMKQGGTLAGMIGDEIRKARRGSTGDGGVTHVVLQLDGRTLSEWWSRSNRAGLIGAPA